MATEYKVTNSIEMTGISNEGKIYKFRRYTLRTKSGSVITVELDEKDWTAEKAGAIFLKAATEEDKIRAL
jgi:hypothetical protein